MHQQPLPSEWIDRLFSRLEARYGSGWKAKWATVEIAVLRADWADVLAGLQNRPAAIRYGLDNLPEEFPPTAVQFRTACNRMPEAMPVALPQPPASPDVVAKVRGAFVVDARDPLAWAYTLKAKEATGCRLTPAQREAWRDALRSKAGTDAPTLGQFAAIAADVLPQGMRA